jgi:hypothetical protein
LEEQIKIMRIEQDPDHRSWLPICEAFRLAPECCGLTLASMSNHYDFEQAYLDADQWKAPSCTSDERIHFHHMNNDSNSQETNPSQQHSSVGTKQSYVVYSAGLAQPISQYLSTNEPPKVVSTLHQQQTDLY